jgi:hypothetical protein
MNKINTDDLLNNFTLLVKTERKITAQVLECLAEIDRRKVYLDRGFSNLHDFLVKEHGYSSGAAVRRVSAARLLQSVPEIKDNIETGSLNLSQLAAVNQALKAHQIGTGERIQNSAKAELLRKVQGKTHRETEVLIKQELGIEAPKIEKTVNHADESVTLTVTFTKDQFEQLQRARDLASHALPYGTWAEVITYLARKEIQRRKSNAPLPPKRWPTAAKSIKRQLLNQFDTCQFKDSLTGQVCGSRVRLQTEHIQPKWAGGSDDPSNLTVLCANHNRHKYQKQAGISSAASHKDPSSVDSAPS